MSEVAAGKTHLERLRRSRLAILVAAGAVAISGAVRTAEAGSPLKPVPTKQLLDRSQFIMQRDTKKVEELAHNQGADVQLFVTAAYGHKFDFIVATAKASAKPRDYLRFMALVPHGDTGGKLLSAIVETGAKTPLFDPHAPDDSKERDDLDIDQKSQTYKITPNYKVAYNRYKSGRPYTLSGKPLSPNKFTSINNNYTDFLYTATGIVETVVQNQPNQTPGNKA